MNKGDWMLMGITALFFDTIGLMLKLSDWIIVSATFGFVPPIIGWLFSRPLSLFAISTFLMWGKIKGIKNFTSKVLLGAGFESIPLFGALFPWTITIGIAYFKDKAVDAISGKAQQQPA